MTNQNITGTFINSAQSFPRNLAIVDKYSSINYATLLEEVLATASYFQCKGIRQGDRVLVFVPMSIDLYRVVLAITYLGAVAVFLDEWADVSRLRLCCKIANCKGFVGGSKALLMSYLLKETRSIPLKLSLSGRAKTPIKMQSVDADADSLITFTTGSTGTPKAARRSHGFLGTQLRVLKAELNVQASDVDMASLPIVLLVNLACGATSVIPDFQINKSKAQAISKVVEQLQVHSVSRITASPYLVKLLANYCIKHRVLLPALRSIFTGGAPVFSQEAHLFDMAFEGVEIVVVYGSTEAEPISIVSSSAVGRQELHADRGLLVGRPHKDLDVRIIPISHNTIAIEAEIDSIEVNDGEIGEIVVAGDHVLSSYIDNVEAYNHNKIREKDKLWHRTGDSGFLIAGNLYLTGRCKQMIEHRGQQIAPFIVESILAAHPDIEAGTVLKIGKKLVVIVESKSVVGIEELMLPFRYDEVVKVAKLPRDPRHNSKIDYAKLAMIVGKRGLISS